jgi:hypothetical protein
MDFVTIKDASGNPVKVAVFKEDTDKNVQYVGIVANDAPVDNDHPFPTQKWLRGSIVPEHVDTGEGLAALASITLPGAVITGSGVQASIFQLEVSADHPFLVALQTTGDLGITTHTTQLVDKGDRWHFKPEYLGQIVGFSNNNDQFQLVVTNLHATETGNLYGSWWYESF